MTCTNERGNVVHTGHVPGDRYRFDLRVCARADGWRQFDTGQDASYFGVWVHVERRAVVTFCEGDVTVVECPTAESLRAELLDAAAFYGPEPAAFTVIGADGRAAGFRDANGRTAIFRAAGVPADDEGTATLAEVLGGVK